MILVPNERSKASARNRFASACRFSLQRIGRNRLPQFRATFSDSGSAIVEFAVASTVLFMMLFGIIQACLALYTYNYISDAARVATRYASVRGSSCSGMSDCGATASQIQTYLRGIPYPGIKSSNLTVAATWFSASSAPPTTWTACGSQCNAPGNEVQVTVTYAFSLNIPFWKKAAINMSSASQTVIYN